MTAQKEIPLMLGDDTKVEFIPPHVGALAAALAKAQTEFDTVTRSKTVTVQKKTGGSYQFSYAPLDTILDAVRGPLAKNGLVLVQMLDEGALTTTLIHESGASISGSIGLPGTADIQAFGSAVTYLRRYAIQAVLGIAAEEDDDGNRAAGNRVSAGSAKGEPRQDDGGLIGTAEVGKSAQTDFELRQTPDGMALGFRLRGDKGGIKVVAHDPLATLLADLRDEVIGQRVTCWGVVSDETFTVNKGKPNAHDVVYQVLTLSKIKTPTFSLPGEPGDMAEPVPAFSEGEQTAIDEAMDKTGAAA